MRTGSDVWACAVTVIGTLALGALSEQLPEVILKQRTEPGSAKELYAGSVVVQSDRGVGNNHVVAFVGREFRWYQMHDVDGARELPPQHLKLPCVSGPAVATVGDRVVFAGGNVERKPYDMVRSWNARDQRVDPKSYRLTDGGRTGLMGAPVTAADGSAACVTFAGGWSISGFSSAVDMFCQKNSVAQPVLEPVTNNRLPSGGRARGAAASLGSLVFFGGGEDAKGPSAAVDVRNITSMWTANWQESYALSAARFDLTAVAIGNCVLFAGGKTADEKWFAAVDFFCVNSLGFVQHTWQVDALSEARSGILGVAIGDYAVFLGGHTVIDTTGNAIDLWNSRTGRWSSASDKAQNAWLPQFVYLSGATTDNGWLLLIGSTTDVSGTDGDEFGENRVVLQLFMCSRGCMNDGICRLRVLQSGAHVPECVCPLGFRGDLCQDRVQPLSAYACAIHPNSDVLEHADSVSVFSIVNVCVLSCVVAAAMARVVFGPSFSTRYPCRWFKQQPAEPHVTPATSPTPMLSSTPATRQSATDMIGASIGGNIEANSHRDVIVANHVHQHHTAESSDVHKLEVQLRELAAQLRAAEAQNKADVARIAALEATVRVASTAPGASAGGSAATHS